ncbi:hypothetical protein HDU76_009695, partial [Blyttiomyces sp. JEL0837]
DHMNCLQRSSTAAIKSNCNLVLPYIKSLYFILTWTITGTQWPSSGQDVKADKLKRWLCQAVDELKKMGMETVEQ